MKYIALASVLFSGTAQSFDAYPITSYLSQTATPIATAAALASVVPFDVNYVDLPGYQEGKTLAKYSNATWKVGIDIYDSGKEFGSLLTLSWPVGKGPGPGADKFSKSWNACFITLPALLEQLRVQGPGDGTCFDIINDKCLYTLMSNALWTYTDVIHESGRITKDIVAQACEAASNLPLIPECFKHTPPSPAAQTVQGHATANPPNNQPFLLGIDPYEAKGDAKAGTQAGVISRAWPMIILESQGNYTVQAVLTCPSAALGDFSDDFSNGMSDHWYVAAGSADASSKALVAGKNSIVFIDHRTFSDFSLEMDITIPSDALLGPNIFFRAQKSSDDNVGYDGYSLSLHPTSGLELAAKIGYHDSSMSGYYTSIPRGVPVHLKVAAVGDSFKIYLGDTETPQIVATDASYRSGIVGFRTSDYAGAAFDNIKVNSVVGPASSRLASSPDGTCGGQLEYSCTNTTLFYGNCCGARGYCGYSKDECSDTLGCQSKYGLCDTTVTVTTTAAPAHPTSSPMPTASNYLDDFNNRNMTGWKVIDGNFDASSGELVVSETLSGKAVYDATFDNCVVEADIAITKGGGNGGLIFRASNLASGEDGYRGYYAGLNPDGWIHLGRSDGRWTQIQAAQFNVAIGQKYHIKVKAIGDLIEVYVNDMNTPQISQNDGTFAMGAAGVRVWHTGMRTDNFRVEPSKDIFESFNDHSMAGWKVADGSFDASSGELIVSETLSGKAVYDATFNNFIVEANIAITKGGGNGGLIFRASSLASGEDGYRGYYAGLNPDGWIHLGRSDGHWTQIQAAQFNVAIGQKYHLKVKAIDDLIQVYVNDMNTPKISQKDGTFTAGAAGVRVWHTGMRTDNFKVVTK